MSTIPVSSAASADPATRRVVRHEPRHLPVRLSDAELLARGQELANTIQEITVEESRLATLKSQAKARLEELAGRHARLAAVVRAREEYRDVVVEVIFDYEAQRVMAVRPDTGEAVDQRAMTDDERQRRLFPTDGGEPADSDDHPGDAGEGDAEGRAADRDDGDEDGDDPAETPPDPTPTTASRPRSQPRGAKGASRVRPR